MFARELKLKSCSPIVDLGVAAGLYLLLMWGYLALPSGQWFAAFLALIMSAMLIFWVSESTADAQAQVEPAPPAEKHSQPPATATSADHSLEAAVLRLDSLKAELTAQYAQFGRDQSLINSNGLGSWHRLRNPRSR